MTTERQRKHRVLLVDDVPENIDVLSGVLADYTRNVALDGPAALELAGSGQAPDLIILDVMMPGMDGFEVCRRLKADARTRDIPVIFLTARTEAEDEARGLELGAVDFIPKPINPAVVRARVRTHLELKSAREELERQNEALREAAQLREDVERMTRHDLKSPLTAIIGLPPLIVRQGKLSSVQTELLNRIPQAGRKMLDIINRSLDLFKMERSSYDFRPEPMDLIPVLRDVLEELQSAILLKELDVRIQLDGRPVGEEDRLLVLGEKLLCYSMLSNLVKNAVEASATGCRVSVLLACGHDESSVTVQNPAEVPEAIRGRFFDKYVTSGKSTGTGLGTYSARLIAETQGGSIRMESSAEQGTRVTVALKSAPGGSA